MFYSFGRFLLFIRNSLFIRPDNMVMYRKEAFRQMNSIGIESMAIVAVVALFIGAVTAIQFSYQIQDFAVPAYYIGYIVRDSMIIEMAPTVSAMILAGKVGSNMASELGNMRITEQIDALEIMGVNAQGYLVGTKVIAALVTIPMLVAWAALIGILGGLGATLLSGAATLGEFKHGLMAFFMPMNFRVMIIKSCCFALLLSIIACFQGYFVKGGAVEVGNATTRAVVQSNIAILVFDYIIAAILLQ
ncbi:MAG: ABC transporter permease [Sphingobacteriales bacterium]|nr:ABC transporter permease [Sphingobacteriales bacterium]MBK6889703.1 ABC transporter permease [Sphingobacteriales bacterium]MBK7527783.1 ABC transporter permease [Sphingobacteriales bacterium]MBL0246492.1 ABC transporter permease [Sphingobacteriales bacterium]